MAAATYNNKNNLQTRVSKCNTAKLHWLPLNIREHVSMCCKWNMKIPRVRMLLHLFVFFWFLFSTPVRPTIDKQTRSEDAQQLDNSALAMRCGMLHGTRLQTNAENWSKVSVFFYWKKSNIEVRCACNLSLQSGNWSFADALLLSTTQLHYVGAVQHSCISVQVH